MKKILLSLLTSLFLIFTSCESLSNIVSSSPVSNVGKRVLNLSGMEIAEDEPLLGGVQCWYAKEYLSYRDNGEILLQVGYFNNVSEEMSKAVPELSGGRKIGYVLYGDGTEGTLAVFQRQGLTLRWDWGDRFQYSFVIKDDNTGLYYDFSTSSDGTSKPRSLYKMTKF